MELEYVDLEEPKSNHRPLVSALASVTGFDIRMHAPRLGRSAKKLNKAGYTADQVKEAFGVKGNWYSQDWRGKKGQKPTPELVCETIKNLMVDKYEGGKFAEFVES